MRKWIAASACLGLVACSAKPETSAADESTISAPRDDQSRPSAATDAAQPNAFTPPGIDISAAPGVAFAYRYAFRLPSDKIAAVQEVHAQACEKLGVARCRIVGMRYRLLGENNVEAMLAFKLDPAIARGFGKDGIAAAGAAQGKLVDAEITGTDAAAAIRQLAVGRAQTEDELKRLDTELARPGLKSAERDELQRQRADTLHRTAANRDTIVERQDSLATTPMVFEYGSGAAIRGFDASAPVKSAVDTAVGSAQITLAFLLGAIALIGPPGLVVLAAFLLWRRFRAHRSAAATAVKDPITPS